MPYRVGAAEITRPRRVGLPARRRESRAVPVGDVHAIDDQANAICGAGPMHVVGPDWHIGLFHRVCPVCEGMESRAT